MKVIELFVSLTLVCCISFAKDSTVIIIGAGPSGIAAASKLNELNVDVLVLEAEPRLGGRINSVHFGNAFVDLGAQWCHGEKGNIVYELVKNDSILSSSILPTRFYSSDRQPVDDLFNFDLDEIVGNLFIPNQKPKEGITVGEYLIKNYNSTIRENYAHDQEKLDFAFELLDWIQHYVQSLNSALSWFDASALSDSRGSPGDQHLNWSGYGYRTILDVLMKKYPTSDPSFQIENKIVINQEVKTISWGEIGVNITCLDGSVYIADHAIFTPSLGVLKNKHKSLFRPHLPISKTKAIRDLGIGAFMKVMMHFPIRWWPTTNFSGFSLVWNCQEKQMLVVEFPYGPSLNGMSWLLDLFVIMPVENNPNVLSVWFTGKLVPEIEKITDSILVNGIMFAFDKFFGHKYTITHPKKILRSNWYSNPHFQGAYSYQTVASRKVKPSSNMILSEPLYDHNHVPRVMFAGEATHPFYYSTVHGAIETGFREANIIAKYLNRKAENKVGE